MTIGNALLCVLLDKEARGLADGLYDTTPYDDQAINLMLAMCLARSARYDQLRRLLPRLSAKSVAHLSRYCLFLGLGAGADASFVLTDLARNVATRGIAAVWLDLAVLQSVSGHAVAAVRSLAMYAACGGAGVQRISLPSGSGGTEQAPGPIRFLHGDLGDIRHR